MAQELFGKCRFRRVNASLAQRSSSGQPRRSLYGLRGPYGRVYTPARAEAQSIGRRGVRLFRRTSKPGGHYPRLVALPHTHPGRDPDGPGTLIHYALRWRGLPLSWTTRITEWNPPGGFVDVQLRGPYRLWEHTHIFQPVAGGTLVHDMVRYTLPLGVLGRLAHAGWVRADLNAIFDFRARKVSELLGASVRP
jgi:ligand-binding SRPBCC domain-containing protein